MSYLLNHPSFTLDCALCHLVLPSPGISLWTFKASSLHLEGGKLCHAGLSLRDLFSGGCTSCHLSLWSMNSKWCAAQNGNFNCQNNQLPVLKASVQRSTARLASLKVCWAKAFSASSEDYHPTVPVVGMKLVWTNISQAPVEGIKAVLLSTLNFNTFVTWVDFILSLSTNLIRFFFCFF